MSEPQQQADSRDDRPVLFVGDIQGCARELALLLERAGFLPGTHRLLSVGDVVNRGPDSPGALAVLAQAGGEPVQGNHERGLLEAWRSGRPRPWDERPDSAYVQLRAAGRWEAAMAEIARWPLVRRGPGWVTVHAGLHPRLPPERTDPAFLTEVRFCDAAGTRPAKVAKTDLEGPPGFAPWWRHYAGDDLVVFGHWAVRGLVVEGRVRGLDTGCVYGGELTGLWWPDDRLVQVPALAEYHPVGRRRRTGTGSAHG